MREFIEEEYGHFDHGIIIHSKKKEKFVFKHGKNTVEYTIETINEEIKREDVLKKIIIRSSNELDTLAHKQAFIVFQSMLSSLKDVLKTSNAILSLDELYETSINERPLIEHLNMIIYTKSDVLERILIDAYPKLDSLLDMNRSNDFIDNIKYSDIIGVCSAIAHSDEIINEIDLYKPLINIAQMIRDVYSNLHSNLYTHEYSTIDFRITPEIMKTTFLDDIISNLYEIYIDKLIDVNEKYKRIAVDWWKIGKRPDLYKLGHRRIQIRTIQSSNRQYKRVSYQTSQNNKPA